MTGIGYYFPIILFLGIMLLAFVAVENYQHGTKSSYDRTKALDKNATITDIQHKETGLTTQNATIHTTVTFSDGFSYLCHDYDMDRHFGGATIYISQDTLNNIKKKAEEAHRIAYEVQIGSKEGKSATEVKQELITKKNSEIENLLSQAAALEKEGKLDEADAYYTKVQELDKLNIAAFEGRNRVGRYVGLKLVPYDICDKIEYLSKTGNYGLKNIAISFITANTDYNAEEAEFFLDNHIEGEWSKFDLSGALKKSKKNAKRRK